jgi:hypothetical protein
MLRWFQELLDEFRPKKNGYEIFFTAKGMSLKKIK